MNNKPYEEIKVVLAEPRSSLRKEYLGVLKDLGCKNIIETGNIKDVHTALEEGGVDLLIGDTTLPEGDLSEVIHHIRHGQCGDNPFVIAMILVSKSDKKTDQQSDRFRCRRHFDQTFGCSAIARAPVVVHPWAQAFRCYFRLYRSRPPWQKS